MTEQEIINNVRTIIAKKFQKEPNGISIKTNFAQDLGADSLDMMEIAWEVSDHFKIPTGEFEDKGINTVDDLVTLICKCFGINRSTDKGSSNIIALVTVIGQKRRNMYNFTKTRTK